MAGEETTYQDIMRNEFLRRRGSNNLYSIRAYARDLGISQPFLSQVLSKKRKLSDDKAVLIAEKLKLKSEKKKFFVLLARIELAQDPATLAILGAEKAKLLKKNPNFFNLSEDIFRVISDWHFYAILELVGLKGFVNDLAWMAKRLHISQADVELALQRLKRLGLLVAEGDRLIRAQNNYAFRDIPSEAIRKHHHQSLDLAHAALKKQPMENREFTTMTLALDPKKLAKAQQMINDFNKEFLSTMEDTEPKSIYKINIQLFRLDQETK